MHAHPYAPSHAHWTIPAAAVLTALFYPFKSRIDSYKIAFLTVVALVATTPWDSYLVRTGVWSYPPDAVFGWTLFSIPAEEYFFFLVQTYTTSVFYLLLGKPIFHPAYLSTGEGSIRGVRVRTIGRAGAACLAAAFLVAAAAVRAGGRGTYLGLIVAWMAPFLLFLWCVYMRPSRGCP